MPETTLDVALGQAGKQLAKGAFGSLGLALSSRLLMLVTSALLARFMGATNYGVYATATAMVLLLSVPTSFGQPILVLRLLASYRVKEKWGLMRGLLVTSNLVVLTLSLIIVSAAAILIWVYREPLGPEKSAAFLYALALVPLTTLGALRSASLRGLHHITLGLLPESLVMPVVFLLLVLAAWVGLGTLAPTVAIGARLAAATIAFLVGAVLLAKHLPQPVKHAQPRYDLNHWARSSAPLFVIGGLNILNMQTDVLMLATLSGSKSAGIYQAATRGAELTAFALVVVNLAIQPTISRLYTQGDMARLQKISTLGARAALMIALPIAGLMIFWGEPLMGLVFGSEFKAGAMALAILAGAQIINAGMGFVNDLLNMTGNAGDTAIGLAVGAVANIGLNAILIPIWDIEGAALASALSLIVWNAFLAIQVHRRIGLNPTALGSYPPRIT